MNETCHGEKGTYVRSMLNENVWVPVILLPYKSLLLILKRCSVSCFVHMRLPTSRIEKSTCCYDERTRANTDSIRLHQKRCR